MLFISYFLDTGSSLQDFDSEDKFPFAHCGNPVMALVTTTLAVTNSSLNVYKSSYGFMW